MDESFRKLTGRTRGEPQTLNHKGRSITVPEAALGVARFTFADLCAAPLGSLDYQRIAHSYHTLMIEEIPVLGPEQRNEARRLVILIDVLYDNGVGLIASAAAEPHDTLRGWHWGRGLRPHRFTAHGNALGGLSGGAASAERSADRARLKGMPHALAGCGNAGNQAVRWLGTAR